MLAGTSCGPCDNSGIELNDARQDLPPEKCDNVVSVQCDATATGARATFGHAEDRFARAVRSRVQKEAKQARGLDLTVTSVVEFDP